MWLFGGRSTARSVRSPAELESLERQVTVLRATLATCKSIAQRRKYWLDAAIAALVVVSGFLIFVSRQTLEPAIVELIPASRTGTPTQGVDAAYAAYQNGDYATALRLSRPLAEKGDARAQSLLGLIYYNGRGVRQDEREAVKWFKRAAEQGDAASQLQLGIMYSEGRGVPQDYSEAAKWYQLAADKNTPEAEYNLGILYAYGQGVPQDNVLAHMWFNRAAALFTASVPRNRAASNRDIVARRMSPDEIARAQELARR
jgi:uncharacterized protein